MKETNSPSATCRLTLDKRVDLAVGGLERQRNIAHIDRQAAAARFDSGRGFSVLLMRTGSAKRRARSRPGA